MRFYYFLAAYSLNARSNKLKQPRANVLIAPVLAANASNRVLIKKNGVIVQSHHSFLVYKIYILVFFAAYKSAAEAMSDPAAAIFARRVRFFLSSTIL